MRGDWYQLSLIFMGVVVTALFGAFLYQEIFPDYKVYQNTYLALEEFRSEYTGAPMPPFEFGIKQIVLEKGGGAPPVIDRCTSCHVAMEFSHFSPTKLAKDVNGNPVYDAQGLPVQEPNEEYVWAKLDQKIEDLSKSGNPAQAARLSALKTDHSDDHIYDMTKALRAHPLMGRETRPFEHHPVEEYGCTVCHGGNGRALTVAKAHGPVFDDQYKAEYMGPKPEFTERDPLNDPLFARVFNDKPGHELLFQTTPLLVGGLIQANCVQCHTSSQGILKNARRDAEVVSQRNEKSLSTIEAAYANELQSLQSLLKLHQLVKKEGKEKTLQIIEAESTDLTRPEAERAAAKAQADFLRKADEKTLFAKLEMIVGSRELTEKLIATPGEKVEAFLVDHQKTAAGGSLFEKLKAKERAVALKEQVKASGKDFNAAIQGEKMPTLFSSEIDKLTRNFHRGESLFLSQGCYSCHRIGGFSRGGVGPELTNEGEKYPWFIKESMVWPQADLKTSEMPNFQLDHEELEDLMTFLLAQRGRNRKTSETEFKTAMLNWEAGYKLPWERPINPGRLHDLPHSMTLFATEGCASCHRLKGYESNVGFAVEKNTPDFETLYQEKEWFKALVPEEITGSELVKVLDEQGPEFQKRLAADVRTDALLETMEKQHPKLIESFNTSFKYARRAKNHAYKTQLAQTQDPAEHKRLKKAHKEWKETVDQVLMIYVQEYGLGRLICPRPNWSGIFRSDEWLIEHFRKPSRHTARSIMPAFPFDDSKFYALTYMLDVLGKRNRDAVRTIWENRGFDPAQAYDIFCSQCHGEFLHGNGPVARWIYPIPKNLRNATFLRNLTRENVLNSIIHGVKGTPMPPWGEVHEDKLIADGIPVITENQAEQLVDWLFSSLLGGTVIRSEKDVEKWRYQPEDVLEELEKENNQIQPGPPPQFLELNEAKPAALLSLNDEHTIAALEPSAPRENVSRNKVEKVFDVVPNPFKGSEPFHYYIKPQYYNEQNITQGQQYFELNCAVCHGKEADGQGFRAGTMYDAKPRMLTNFHWLDTRDDLRLLRSLKYGVAGTSMTAWGDLTTSLQRLQLIIYIRSLNKEQQENDKLFNAIYEVYDRADQVIDTARILEYQTVNAIEAEINEVEAQEQTLPLKIEKGLASPQESAALFLKKLNLRKSLNQHKQADEMLVRLKDLVSQEAQVYQNLGVLLIGITIDGDSFDHYLTVVHSNSLQYGTDKGRLTLTVDQDKTVQGDEAVEKLAATLQQGLETTREELKIVGGKLPSRERSERLEKLNQQLKSYQRLKDGLISGHEKGKRLRKEQQSLFEAYSDKLKTLNTQKTHD